MGNNRYGNINELISEVEALGDWKDINQRSNFFKILSKIAVIYNGYDVKNENGDTTSEYYPEEVLDAIVEVCKGKFPSDKREAYDEANNLREGYPEYSNYLLLATDRAGIGILGERSRIDSIAKKEFGINVYDGTATREEIDGLINSSKEFLNKKKEQELGSTGITSKRQEIEASIVKSKRDKEVIKMEIDKIDKEIDKEIEVMNENKEELNTEKLEEKID